MAGIVDRAGVADVIATGKVARVRLLEELNNPGYAALVSRAWRATAAENN